MISFKFYSKSVSSLFVARVMDSVCVVLLMTHVVGMFLLFTDAFHQYNVVVSLVMTP